MNYQGHYNNLINRARERNIDGYVERHHVVPRCMNGADEQENIVKLTAEEHYLAHLLLVKIYANNDKLVYAANMMTWDRHGKHSSNKRYGWLRRLFSKEISAASKKRMNDVCFKNASIARLNTPEAKAKSLEAVRSPKERARRSALFNDPKYRATKLLALHSPEAKAKSIAGVRTPEIRKKRSISAKKRMANPEMIAFTHTENARKKRSAAMKRLWKNHVYRTNVMARRQEYLDNKRISL